MSKLIFVFVALFVCAFSTQRVIFNYDCSRHVLRLPKESGDSADVYVMQDDRSLPAYARVDWHGKDSYYVYEKFFFDLQTRDGWAKEIENRSSWPNDCKVENRVQPLELMSYFDYTAESTVPCPFNSEAYCLEYCDNTRCYTTDAIGRLVDFDNYRLYLYLDDKPTVDTFNGDCDDVHFTAEDKCLPYNKIKLNMSCYSHILMENKQDSIVFDSYWLMEGDDLMYVHAKYSEGQTEYTNILRFDLMDQSGYVFVASTDSADQQRHYWEGRTHYMGFMTEFGYRGEPEAVSCSEEGGECLKYCNEFMYECIVVDEFNHLLQFEHSFDGPHTITYTYLDGIPTDDMFYVELENGTKYEVVDNCPRPSSSSFTSTSSTTSTTSTTSRTSKSVVSAASVTKALFTVVFAAFILALF